MTQKEKAEELYSNYLGLLIKNSNTYIDNGITEEQAKQCALIAVDLHLEELSKMKLIFSDREFHYKFWQEVKQEIKKL
jgi:hypothetical protein